MGCFVSSDVHTTFENAYYNQFCYQSIVPQPAINIGGDISELAGPLPIVAESWVEWSRESNSGQFSYSVIPIIYSISVSSMITWFLTIFVLTNYTIKASLLLRTSTTFSSIYLFVTGAMAIHFLKEQSRNGYLHGPAVLDKINESILLNVLDLISIVFLQVNQVQVIMRIFSRQKDKRFAFVVGITCTLTSQIIWAVTKFYSFDHNDEAGDILPAFVYLVRIAMGVCYAALISVYIFTKINIILANKSLWLLTFLTCVLIYSPVAFFIADVSNYWVFELSEIFSCVTYVIGVVIPWEWYNRFNVVLKSIEKNGLLGRRFYEDEIYELDRYELFTEDNEHDHHGYSPDDRPSDSDSGPNVPSGGAGAPNKFTDNFTIPRLKIGLLYNKTRDAVLKMTDVMIATGLAIPRSVSVQTPPIEVARGDEDQLQGFNSNMRQHPNRQAQDTGRNRRDVYVYSKKSVVINLSDSEHETSSTSHRDTHIND